MCYCIPYHTENKLLVPEWPCIIEVSYIYSSYNSIFQGTFLYFFLVAISAYKLNLVDLTQI
jgi:hypothetical protein